MKAYILTLLASVSVNAAAATKAGAPLEASPVDANAPRSTLVGVLMTTDHQDILQLASGQKIVVDDTAYDFEDEAATLSGQRVLAVGVQQGDLFVVTNKLVAAPDLLVSYSNFYLADDDETATCRIYADNAVVITFDGIAPAPSPKVFQLTGDQDEALAVELENFDNRPGGHQAFPADAQPHQYPIMGATLADFAQGLKLVTSPLDHDLASVVKGTCQIDGNDD